MSQAGGQLLAQQTADRVTLLASTTDATAHTVNGAAVNIPRPHTALVLECDITAAATAANDTLDVKVQVLIDGTNWLDVCHFTQALGNGGAKRFYAKLVGGVAEAMFENGTSLAAGSIRNILGDQYRVSYTIASGTTASFTFSVTCRPM